MNKRVSVIVPAHNESKHITRCLESLLRQDFPKHDYEIIVVDNASNDETAMLAKSFKSINYLYKKEGPVGAVRNFGVSFAKGDTIAFIDGDCVAPEDWLKTGSILLDSNPQTAFGGKYSLDQYVTWIERYWLLGLKNSTSDKIDLLGGTIFIKKEHFNLVGGFNENISSGEDSQLASDLRSSGIAVKIDQTLNVIHLGNAKTVRDFIRRQAWHSENYIDRLRISITDPTFVITIAFDTLIIASATSLISGSWNIFLLCLMFIFFLVSTLSIKRISRSRDGLKLISNFHKIFFLDLLYLSGRTVGIIRGLKKRIVH